VHPLRLAATKAGEQQQLVARLKLPVQPADERGTTDHLPIETGTTVRDLLTRLSAESPKFAELVYDRADDRLKEYAALILNPDY